ncbi:MAG: 50S ribosomal protein L5 [Candidatus Hodarchaeales archaeon]|jgi:large subunit ribosomal protein L5
MDIDKIDKEKYKKDWDKIPMRSPRLHKVTVNFAVGKSGPELEKARNLAEKLTGRVPQDSKAHDSIRGFGVRKGEPIGVHVTLRGDEGHEFLRKVFWSKDDTILVRNFDKEGNLALGIKDHLNLPEIRYDPKIGVFGFGVTANLERPGFRLKRRRLKRKKIPTKHRLTKEEAIVWYLTNFENLKIVEKKEEDYYF